MTLRDLGFDGDVTLLGDETVVAYSKPPLSKSYQLDAEPTVVQLHEAHELAAVGVRVELGTEVAGVDVAGRSLVTACHQTLDFSDLVIATGVRPRSLPVLEGFDNTMVLRTLADAERLRHRLVSAARLCVVGGGFIGAELAAVARELGKQVVIVEAEHQPMLRTLGPHIGEAVGRLHEAHGVDLRLGTRVTAVHGADNVERMELSDGSVVEADLVVVSVGVQPATSWLDGTGFDTSDGVLADEFCRVAPHVWAAGDVARWHNRRFDRTMRVEHWSNAGEQGAAVARNIVAPHPYRYSPLPYFWSDQYDASIHFLGVATPQARVEFVTGDASREEFVALFASEDGSRLTGALGFRSRLAVFKLRALFDRPRSLDEAVRDARSELAGSG